MEQVSRRTFLKGTAGVGAGALLLGGTGTADAAMRQLSPRKTTGQLSVAILGNAASNKVALQAFNKFQKETGIKTTPVFINVATWVEFFQQIEIRLAAGTNIDTMNLATEGMRLFASKKVLQPLDAYIAKDKAAINEFYADVNPRALKQFRQYGFVPGDKNTYFIPWGYNTMGIWYNRKTFKAGKVSEPTPDWTWDDFEAAAKALTKAPSSFGMNLTIDVFQGIEPWVFTNGGQVLSDDWTKCIVNNKQAVEAVTFARSLVKNKYAPTPGGTYNEFVGLQQGHLAMMGAGIWPYNTFIGNGAGIKDLAIVPWPKKTQQGSPVGLATFPILANSSNKDEAWEFVKYSISQSFQLNESVPIEGGMPMRQSIAKSQKFLKSLPPGAEYFQEALNYATPVVGVSNASAVEAEIDTGWQQILTGAVSPSEGLAQMESKCNAAIAQSV
jgi:multiple sugar transport system substrate-binding protein